MAPKRPGTSTSSSGTSTPSKQPSSTAIPTNPSSTTSSSSASASTQLTNRSSPSEIAQHVWNNYLKKTPIRTKLLDIFMGWLVVVGGLQFVYCVVGGNYPFNAFLSGFSAAVGQFVLTASLRMQISSPAHQSSSSSNPTTASSTSPDSSSIADNKITRDNASSAAGAIQDSDTASSGVIFDLGKRGKGYSPERAFADYIFGSVILHLFCVNFIN